MASSKAQPLTYDQLRTAVAGDAAAIRYRLDLQPAGGDDDKVFPPTYAGGQYALENRRVGGKEVRCVLLDSVQSQANRLELALQQAFDDRTMRFPLLEADFSGAGIVGIERITALQAPHRIADAIFRDSEFKGKPFRESDIGQRFTTARSDNATALFELCPTALVFGVWDSTGSAGGLGNKFARALVSEIIGWDAVLGVRTSSRVDPLGIEKCSIYEHKDSTKENPAWTVDESQAKVETDKNGEPVLKDGTTVPLLFKRKTKDKGKPSEINHGNVTPDINRIDPSKNKDTVRDAFGRVMERGEPIAGGVTISKALQTTVLSLPALRRLRFPDGIVAASADRNNAARTVLAALALAAVVYQRKAGYFLRSRCDLIPTTDDTSFEIVTTAANSTPFSLTSEAAVKIFDQAVADAKKQGLPWPAEEPIRLKPKAAFVELVRRSRELAALDDEEGE